MTVKFVLRRQAFLSESKGLRVGNCQGCVHVTANRLSLRADLIGEVQFLDQILAVAISGG